MKNLYAPLIGSALMLSAYSHAQQGGAPDCSLAALTPVTLPYSATIETTCGMLDDYNGSTIKDSCSLGSARFSAGSDKLYQFTPTLSGTILIYFSASSADDIHSSLFVFSGCPSADTTTCIAINFEPSTNKNLGIVVKQGNTYFLMVDREVSPSNDSCVLQYSISIGEPEPFCQPFITETGNEVDNLDFERGNFGGWTGYTGTCCEINTPTKGITDNRHTITTGGGTDVNTGGRLPVVAPGGGNYSARLGNDEIGAEAERLRYTFKVTENTNCLLYKYAVVLEDPGHEQKDQPRFEIKVYDSNNQILNCGYYKVVAASDIPCFKASPVNSGVIYKDWTTVGVDLRSYVGQDITVEYSTGDCRLTGHYGYAYLDVSATKLQILAEGDFCHGEDTITLIAPPGFQSYLWNTGQTTQTIVVTNANPGDVFTVQLTSIQDNNCVTPLTFVFMDNTSITADFSAPADVCLSDTLNFTDRSTALGDSVNVGSWKWYFGDGDSSQDRNPRHTYPASGTYKITLIASSNLGCMDTITKPISVVQAIDKPAAFCYAKTTNSIEFGWEEVDGAKGYEVSLDRGKTWKNPNSGQLRTSHLVTNLLPDDSVTLLVRTLDNPPCKHSVPTEINCSTLPCSAISLVLSTTDTMIEQGLTTSIQAAVLGGVGPFQYKWTPNIGSGPGPHTIAPDTTTIYVVSVTDLGAKGCPDVVDSMLVRVTCPTVILTTNIRDTLVYSHQPIMLKASATGGIGPYEYKWIPDIGSGPGPHLVNPDTAMALYVTVRDLGTRSCGTVTDSILVRIGCPGLTLLSRVSEPLISRGQSTSIEVVVKGGSGNYFYQWIPAIGNGPGPHLLRPDTNVTCYVTVWDESAENCPAVSDTLRISVTNDCLFYYYIPNAFSPNNDLINDDFRGTGNCIEEYYFKIFDRWGKEIYYTDNIEDAWNGGLSNELQEQMPVGMYVYSVQLKDFAGKRYKYVGLVALTN